MAVFGIALPITLAFEGGYCNNPKDPGGETNHGITMRTFLHTAHPLLGIEPTSDNLKALTPAQAGIIYKANYWDVVHGDDFESQELANNVFDFYVNAGTHSCSLLQRVINDLPTTPAIVVTGSIGDATLAALKSSSANNIYAKFKQGRIDYYTAFGATHPTFLKGLLKRANAFPDLPATS